MAYLIVFDHRRLGVPLIERCCEFEPTPKDEPTLEEHPEFPRIIASDRTVAGSSAVIWRYGYDCTHGVDELKGRRIAEDVGNPWCFPQCTRRR